MKMNSSISLPLLLFCLLLHSLSVKSHDQVSVKSLVSKPYEYLDLDIKLDGKRSLVRRSPALYVFGDSMVDSGNNNYLATMAKANFLPYGVDFLGIPTGRFTNGRTSADILARRLGLPYAPPYLGLTDSQRKNITTGVNYGSGSGGILPDTGNIVGKCLNLDTQIDLFESTVKNDLPKQFSSSEDFLDNLSRSFFFISIGSNDYFLNYLKPQTSLNKNYTPPAFGKYLSDEFSKRLQRLYQLGARKFIVTNLFPIGCSPSVMNTIKPKRSHCVKSLNTLVSFYNAHFFTMITNLKSTLRGSTFIHLDGFKLFRQVKRNHRKFGIRDMTNSCCVDVGRNGTMPCMPNVRSCRNVREHVFFDAIHMTQVSNHLLVKLCYFKSSICSPMNIRELVRV